MRFEVPQFINVPDKLFWIFTAREALYLVGGGGIIYMFFKLLPQFAAIALGIPIAILSLALVFYKPNGRPFIHLVEAFLIYSFTQKFYLWRQKEGQKGTSTIERVSAEISEENIDSNENREKIRNLAWSLDILDFEDKD